MTNPNFKPSRSVMCLSIQQPWAEFVVSGFKSVENRSWKTSFTGVLLIHASSKFDKKWKDKSDTETKFFGNSYINKMTVASMGLWKMPLGKFVGAVIMTGWNEIYDCNWCVPGMKFHRYINPIKFLDPFEGKGKLMMFFPPPGLQTKMTHRDGVRFRKLLTMSKEMGYKTEMLI